MAARSRDPATFWAQADALLRKNLTFQKRNRRANIRLIAFPVVLCVLIRVLQEVINTELDKPENRCGCVCTSMNRDGQCESRSCGLEYSSLDQSIACPVPSPPKWPPILQIPAPEFRVVRTDFLASMDLPNESCRSTGSCPTVTFFTGSNRSLGQLLTGHMLSDSIDINSSNVVGSLANMALGSPMYTWPVNFIEPAFVGIYPVYTVQHQCIASSAIPVLINQSSVTRELEIQCVQGLYLWRNSSSEVNTELYRGYRKGNPERKIDEFVAGYDFLNSNLNNFNISLWYNSTYNNYSVNLPMSLVRIPRSVNLASNSYLNFLKGLGTKILFEFVTEMPKPETEIRIDLSSLIGTLFFTWVVLQLFPVVLVSLVYEKQHNLRLMMKMHGLGDGPYWMISYFYFLILSLLYIITFVIFGSVIGLRFFTLNDYSLQFVFYLVYINLQVSMAFLVAAMFSNVKTAQVVSYIVVFGTGLLGGFLFEAFLEDISFPRGWIIVLELYPGFSLYRGLYEFGQYTFTGRYMGTHGMRWGDLSDSSNGLREVLLIMFVEWLVILIVAYYTDKIGSLGCRKNPLFLFHNFKKQPFLGKPNLQRQESNLQRQDSKVFVQLDKPDVCQEAEKVQQLVLDPNQGHAIICDSLKKVYPGKDGNPAKFAVRELSLALHQGECFGMLGPNGAGKTSFINMMIGLTRPTSGTAFVQGLDIRTEMDAIYTSMGVCPQHDLLWDILTGREHLLFYGRLKNLKGSALAQAVEESLRSMNLFHGGVADKLTEKYSGGMKRRLSVAISLIGDPKVVYMDEPSTGLDPASRRSLWNVIKRAKQDRAIILTTHSMEEAEVLCDRLGIFVDGSFQCIGNPKELKARYGGSYIFSITTPSNLEEEVEKLVRTISPSANRVYQIAGTQKFELPKTEVRIADVFEAVEEAKNRFRVSAWGLGDTTLEDVFIKVARGAQTFNLVQ